LARAGLLNPTVPSISAAKKPNPVTRHRVARLFSRAGFGASLAEIDTWANKGYGAAVDHLLAFDPPSTRADQAEPLGWQGVGHSLDTFFEDPSYHQAWWLSRMASTSYPLEEKLTLYFHDHFATAYSKVVRLGLLMIQNRTLRENAGGSFRTMLQALTQDPAMLWWLDGDVNRVGAINENYGREFLELFSLGKSRMVDGAAVANYTQTDVYEFARTFTGFTTDRLATSTFDATRHDATDKVLLGHTGPWAAADAIDIVLDRHPAGDVAAAYVARRMATFFLHPDPEPELITAMASRFVAGRRFDIKAMVKVMLLHPSFVDGPLRTIKSPAELVAGAVKALDQGIDGTNPAAFLNLRELAAIAAAMGQQLFNPPNVSGWKGGATWANTATTLARYNLASRLARIATDDSLASTVDLANGVMRATTRVWMDRLGIIELAPKTQQAIDQYLAAATAKNDAATTARGVLTLLLASPDYNLR
jgi:uncharacterized protein (DUF1800 family)